MVLLLSGLAALRVAARETVALDTGWVFRLGEAPGAEAPAFADGDWTRVEVPHDWSIGLARSEQAPAGGTNGFFPTGIGWYRRELAVPAGWRGRRVTLEFEGVYQDAEVWLNGVPLGRHHYGYTPFTVELTPHLRFGGRNVLAVRVDNSVQPNCRWYSGSGLYRPVLLHVTAPIHVVPEEVQLSTTALSAAQAVVQVAAAVRNDGVAARTVQIEFRLENPAGRIVARAREKVRLAPGQTWQGRRELTVPRPQPWSPESPALYCARVGVRAGFFQQDDYATTFGVRTLRYSVARGFELNGRPVKLNGGNLHHDTGLLGAVALPRAEERKVELLKAAGYNAARTAHNPPSRAFLEACDRLGLLVMDEGFDGWAKGKNKHDYSRWFADDWRADVEAWIRRDRNHPSVIAWSVGNEMYERGHARGRQIARDFVAAIHALDGTRPVTAGVNSLGKTGEWSQLDELFAAFDLAGYNYELARQAEDHARVPERLMVAAESYQNELFANWSIVQAQPYVVGDFVWSALDYLGEAGIGRVFPPDQPVVKHWEGSLWPWLGSYCGDLDLTGWRKPVSHYRNIVWDGGERLYLAVLAPTADGRPWNLSPWSIPLALPSWTWSGHDGQPLTVEVYSRHEAVRLLLNGVVLGEKPTTAAEAFKATFTVPYAPGELVAVGLQSGRDVERCTLRTAAAPQQLRLTADRATLRADGQDLAYLAIEGLDDRDELNPEATPVVTVAVTGAGTLAALGSGDPATLESYLSPRRALFQGRALAIVRTGRTAGDITVRVSAPGLAPATVSLRTVAP